MQRVKSFFNVLLMRVCYGEEDAGTAAAVHSQSKLLHVVKYCQTTPSFSHFTTLALKGNTESAHFLTREIFMWGSFILQLVW